MDRIVSISLKTESNGWFVLGFKEGRKQEMLMVVPAVVGLERARQIAGKYATSNGLTTYNEM